MNKRKLYDSCIFCLFRCLDPNEEIDLINVAFEQQSSQESESK